MALSLMFSSYPSGEYGGEQHERGELLSISSSASTYLGELLLSLLRVVVAVCARSALKSSQASPGWTHSLLLAVAPAIRGFDGVTEVILRDGDIWFEACTNVKLMMAECSLLTELRVLVGLG